MRTILKHTILFLFILFWFGKNHAQIYPSAVTTLIAPPATVYLNDYFSPVLSKLKAKVVFNDFTETSWNFSLNLKIQSGNISIQTRPGFRPQLPFSVSPGMPVEISGSELEELFSFDNLIFSGITRQELELDNKLPEGFYTFTFEIVDYNTGTRMSHPSSASAYLTLNDPPLITSPAIQHIEENTSAQGILFQWQMNNPWGLINLSQISYELKLYEVLNNTAEPIPAFQNQQTILIWQSGPLNSNSFFYSGAQPALTIGKKYVFTVTARETSNRINIRNDGISEPSWFHFGYPEGGTIELTVPEQDHQFTSGENGLFRWKRPENTITGQMVRYSITICEIEHGQTPESALDENAPLITGTSQPGNALNGSYVLSPVQLGLIRRMKDYAWKVRAFSGQQEIAESQAWKFTGPPVITQFIAGGFLIGIKSLTSFDSLTGKVSGTGSTVIDSSGTQVFFKFRDVVLSPIGNNEWVMSQGIISDSIRKMNFIFHPERVSRNNQAEFNSDSIFINKDILKLKGVVSWKVPLPVQGSVSVSLKSEYCSLILSNNSFTFLNENKINLAGESQIILREPQDFILKISQATDLKVMNSRYSFNFRGFCTLPENVRNKTGGRANIHFENTDQLFYISQENSGSEEITLVDNTNFTLLPVKFKIDLDDYQSPGEFLADSSWKGIYLETARFIIPEIADETGQLTSRQAIVTPISNSAYDQVSLHVNHHGLFLKASFPLNSGDTLRFNTFPGTGTTFEMNIEGGEIKNCSVNGNIIIPLIDTAQLFEYIIPVGDFGLEEGYLQNGLAGTQFIFNPAGSEDQQVNVTIRRALFRGRNRIEMDVDMNWPYFNLSVNNIQGLTAWGNYDIGFYAADGTNDLSGQVSGKLGEYDIVAEKIGCGREKDLYALGVSARIQMAEDISGETGPPVINAYSFYRNPVIKEKFVAVPSGQTLNVTNQDTIPAPESNYESNQSSLNNSLMETYITLGLQGENTGNGGSFNSGGPGNHPDGNENNNIIKNNLVTEAGRILDVILMFKPFISEHPWITEEEWEGIELVRAFLQNDIVKKTESCDVTDLLNYVLNKALDVAAKKITQPIENASANATLKIRQKVNSLVVAPVNNRIDTLIGLVINRLRETALNSAGEEYHELIKFTFSTVKQNISEEVKESVAGSIEQNITAPVTGFIYGGITAQVSNFIREEIKRIGLSVINGQTGESLNAILLNSVDLLENIGDTVVDKIMTLNFRNMKNTAISLGEDAVSNIDWNGVVNQIMQKLIAEGIQQTLIENIQNSFGDNVAGMAGGLLANVQFDFSNLGEKLQNGELGEIIKFDPANIRITTSVCDIHGQVIFNEDDPLWGNSWQANVRVILKVPDKENRKEISAFFVNGKTTGHPQNFPFWFLDMKAAGLKFPLSTVPFTWDGIEGMAYHHMKKLPGGPAIPDISNKYGVGARFYFYDTPGKGRLAIFDAGLDVIINNGGFSVELNGTANIGNVIDPSFPGKTEKSPIATGTGFIGFYSEEKRLTGNFSVNFNTSPLFCAGGGMGLNIQGSDNWNFYIGRQQDPISAKVLCRDWLAAFSYLDLKNNGVKAGLGLNVEAGGKTGWVDLGPIEVRGFASMACGFEARADIEWNPSFRINEAYVHVWANAAVGLDYKTSVKSGSITLAGVSLDGSLLFRSTPSTEVHGTLTGEVTVAGIDIGVDLEVHYDLANKQFIN